MNISVISTHKICSLLLSIYNAAATTYLELSNVHMNGAITGHRVALGDTVDTIDSIDMKEIVDVSGIRFINIIGICLE